MKNLLTKIFSVTALSILSLSCQEDFNPKTDFKEQYVLNSYVDLDYDKYMNTQVYATVSKLYSVDGLDPSQNKIDPSVSGAEIYLNYREILYKLQEDTNKTALTKYGTNQIYYTATLKNIYPNYNVSLTAKMPDGKVLTAQTQLLEAAQLDYSYTFRKYFTTFINRFYWGNAFVIKWGDVQDRFYFPQLIIPCFKPDPTGKNIRYNKQVPLTFINKNGNLEPVYPTSTTGEGISFDYSAIDSTMSQLSREAIDKNSVGYIIFQVTEFDANLSKYYESLHGTLDSYSVSLDQSVYSNIKGGLGIFGSRRILTNQWYFDSTYVTSFGFKW
ncbi:MAG: DUF4249 domain-containing protein [Bacteroidetes bacterium]|nr:DUF4249 domain-containing protein [Bacteroidota bacterium]